MDRRKLLALGDSRTKLTRWSDKYLFSSKSNFKNGKPDLDWTTVRDDPAFAGTNSGIYEISTGDMNHYPSQNSTIINIGLTEADVVGRIQKKFHNTGEGQRWNKRAKEHDLYLRYRSNQKREKNTNELLSTQEALCLHSFEKRHGQMPLMNIKRREMIKNTERPAPIDRAKVIIQDWIKSNEICKIDEPNENLDEIISKQKKNHMIACVESRQKGGFGRTQICFFPTSLIVGHFVAGWKLSREPIDLMYEDINFEDIDTSANNQLIDWNGDNHVQRKMPFAGLGNLTHKLGVLAAIAVIE
jgi:hypothetical protein